MAPTAEAVSRSACASPLATSALLGAGRACCAVAHIRVPQKWAGRRRVCVRCTSVRRRRSVGRPRNTTRLVVLNVMHDSAVRADPECVEGMWRGSCSCVLCCLLLCVRCVSVCARRARARVCCPCVCGTLCCVCRVAACCARLCAVCVSVCVATCAPHHPPIIHPSVPAMRETCMDVRPPAQFS